MWTVARSRTARAMDVSRPGRRGNRSSAAASMPGRALCCAARWTSSPSKRTAIAHWPPHSLLALRTIASKTGCTSVGEAEITCKISLVALCSQSVTGFSARACDARMRI
jgi:hypothetical protein